MNSFESILKKYWGYDSFRGIQREIIESISSGHDTLGLMPTGGGKSITFQVPALSMEGVCIVITPLVALMKDQVAHLRQRYITAACINSDMSHSDVVKVLENAVLGGVKILYISPERLSSELFTTKLRHIKVSFICVDEAHCISQWGYDFRPSYLQISEIRKLIPDVPVLALTATATPDVNDDIQDKLLFKEKRVFRMSFERKNLAYIVRYAADKQDQLIHILSNIKGSAIVYVRSRQRSKDVAEALTNAGLPATYFNAGLDGSEKDKRQTEWQTDKVRIIVATNAFGMGIDKPDVRIVIHIDCPDSIEAYFQEAGRAGRDGRKSYAVLLYNNNDATKLIKRVSDTFPTKDYVKKVYDCLSYFYQVALGSGYNAAFEFQPYKFCKAYGLFPIQVDSALRILDRAGYIEYADEKDNQARVMFLLERDDLYRLHGNSTEEDAIIVALLRSYSGMFNDYVYIDEAFLAQETGFSMPTIYTLLKGLSQKHILSFIPQKKASYIKYTQRRESSEHISISHEIYDDLLERMNKRIEAMISYFSTDNICRSSQLLYYFGEKRNDDCGQCDVCLSRKKQNNEDIKKLETEILQLLSDKKNHTKDDIYIINFPIEMIDQVLIDLIEKGQIIDDDGIISLNW